MKQFELGTDSTSTLQPTRSGFAEFWHEGHRQARRDWLARWRSGLSWLPALVWFGGLFACLGVISAYSRTDNFSTGAACTPDGIFRLDPTSFEYWSGSGFFQITLGFGNLDFTQVKAIDIIWDVVSSRV